MASLGSDLAALRKERGLSLDDVQQITKLSPAVLQSIEDNSIFDQINTNTTYVRSYVRNYAKAIKVDDAEILKALDKAEAGEYRGGLGKSTEESEEAARQSKEEGNRGEGMVHDHSPEYSMYKPAAKSNMAEETASLGKSSSVDWTKVNSKSNKTSSSFFLSRSNGWLWILLLILLVAAGVLVYKYFNDSLGHNEVKATPTAQREAVIPADTLQQMLLPQKNSAQPVFTAQPLPDTLTVAVIAAAGKLEPVRVYTDIAGIRRPYWIEFRDTMRFNFVDEFRVRAVGQFDRMKLVFYGHEIENYYERFYDSEAEMVVLSRSIIEDHPEWR